MLERYDREHRLLPAPGEPGRARTRSWLHWAEASVGPALSDYVGHTVVRPEPKRIPAVAEDATRRLHRVFAAIERALDGRGYIAGDALTAADIMLGFPLHMCRSLGVLGEEHPVALAYHERLAARPAYQRALGEDG